MFRKATEKDIDIVSEIYELVHTEEETGRLTIGWKRGIYPTRRTAEDALAKGTLYVLEEEGSVIAAAKIDREQLPAYAGAAWAFPACEEDVLVLHTLVVLPLAMRQGWGREFMHFYENLARKEGYKCLRIDTNAKNFHARHFYKELGYREAGIVPCVFNGLKNVRLVCLEKQILQENCI